MKNILAIFLILILFTSCHQEADKGPNGFDGFAMEEELEPVPTSGTNSSTTTPLSKTEKADELEKKIIKDGRIGIEVQALNKAKFSIDAIVKKLDGYYAKENLNNASWETAYKLIIRVPSSNFEKLIAEIEQGNGEIKYKEIDARDVTDQFVDLETRLENKRNYLKRYTALLNQAKTIKEILEIEEKIRRLEEEVESTTGRLKYLNNQVSFSTLELELTKERNYDYQSQKRTGFFKRTAQAFSKGWFGFVDFLILLIKIWPFWIIVFVGGYFWRRSSKKKK